MPNTPFIAFWRTLIQFCRLTGQAEPTYGDAAAIWETQTGRNVRKETAR